MLKDSTDPISVRSSLDTPLDFEHGIQHTWVDANRGRKLFKEDYNALK